MRNTSCLLYCTLVRPSGNGTYWYVVVCTGIIVSFGQNRNRTVHTGTYIFNKYSTVRSIPGRFEFNPIFNNMSKVQYKYN